MTPYEFLCKEHIGEAIASGVTDGSEWWLVSLNETCAYEDCDKPSSFERYTDDDVITALQHGLRSPQDPRIDELLRLARSAEHAPVRVMVKSSSQPKGQEGYEVWATPAATQEDVLAAVGAALEARRLTMVGLGMSAAATAPQGETETAS